MNRAFLVVVIMLVGVLPFAMDGASAQSSGSLQGMICTSDYRYEEGADYCQGGALPGAKVVLTRSGGTILDSPRETTTGANGNYAFTNVPSGSYTLDVSRAGFEPVSRAVEVASGTYLELSLQGTAITQTGSILASDGAGISGANIVADGRDSVRGTSDGSGGFSLSLTAGHYSVRISHPEHRSLSDWLLFDGQGAKSFTLEDAPERTVTLSGTVRDQNGAAVAGARIQAYQYGGECCYAYAEDAPATEPAKGQPSSDASYPYYQDNYQETTTDSAGKYTLKLYAGYANLNAYKDGHANYWADFEFKDGESETHDFTMEKFPPKTAAITGKVTGSDGKGLQWISVSVESPRYGIYECSVQSSDKSGGGSGSSSSGDTVMAAPYYENQCAITVSSDGSFSGKVTPGYSILRVYHNHWRSCTETNHADGSYQRVCGPEYMQFVQTVDLKADSSTNFPIKLQPRPAPDATLSGYVVDSETGSTVSGVQVSFSNQDSYSHAWAQTDGDGSYKVKVRSGYHQVSVYAEGFYRWEGVIQVPANGNLALDIHLVPGKDRYGGCCYYYAEGDVAYPSAGHDGGTSIARPEGAPSGATDESNGAEGTDYEDLGGGLGPYNAAKRTQYANQAGELKESAASGLLIGLAGVVALALLRRKEA